MKKFILALGLVATLSTTFVSCSADDANMDTNADDLSLTITQPVDNGNKDLPKPPQRP